MYMADPITCCSWTPSTKSIILHNLKEPYQMWVILLIKGITGTKTRILIIHHVQ